MKMYFFITLVVFFFFVFTQPDLAQMNIQEQETAKKEIGETVNVILRNLEKMDADALFKSYSNSNDFILFTTDASLADYQYAKNHHAEWFKSLSSLKITTLNEEFRFLPGNIAICAWQGNFAMTLRTDVKYKIDKFGVTFILSKIDSLWKVIYQHSSSVPPVQDNQ